MTTHATYKTKPNRLKYSVFLLMVVFFVVFAVCFTGDVACAEDSEKTEDTILEDLDNKKALSFWVVNDNLRKGASSNAVQILNKLIRKVEQND